MNNFKELLINLNPEFEKLNTFIEEKIKYFNNRYTGKSKELFSEKDTILITYADQFSSQNKSNLQTLKQFLSEDLKDSFSIVHLLPFYPWTSDDGFSPVDYQEVDQNYGNWDDVQSIKSKKMYDCVFNHVSSKNAFFKKALSGNKKFQDMFHFVDEKKFNTKEFQNNIQLVVRPRTTELFTPFKVQEDQKYAWTTFSADQIDTNLNNIDMMKYLLETFFFYIDKGAQYFRVDAVPFMWKEYGTNCSHLPKTHTFVQLLRSIIDEINTDLYIVTESNVPHKENITYWGNGSNEAHIIYNFSLAPLILHALTFKDSNYINRWAKQVFDISPKTTFLNFTASHDGIGMRGLEGIVPDEDLFKLCELAEKKGGVVGKKKSRDGTIRPYELNITWASMLKESNEDEELFIRKIVNSHCIVMFFPGIGAHYVHNLLGSENWVEGYEESGIPRRLNRKKLSHPLSLNSTSEKIKNGILELIKLKTSRVEFSPNAKIIIHELHEQCLCFSRILDDKEVKVFFNLTANEINVQNQTLQGYELLIL